MKTGRACLEGVNAMIRRSFLVGARSARASVEHNSTVHLQCPRAGFASVSPKQQAPLRVGLIGHGAIGAYVAQKLLEGSIPNATLSAVLVNRQREEKTITADGVQGVASAPITNDPEEFLKIDWDLAVEAGGQDVVRSLSLRCLEMSRSFLLTSVGALTDDDLHTQLVGAASKNGVQLMVAAGALPAMDWMGSACFEDIEEVRITQTKQPAGWKGTPADEQFDLDAISKSGESTIIFEGPARQAASLYPKNANISAALGLSTIGLDRTQVRLVADPGVKGPKNEVFLKGVVGEISIEVKGMPMRGSPRTSYIVPLSVCKAIKNLAGPEFIGL